jgi:RNA polymerase sigma-70 factor (ECF subfamily)
MTIDHGRPTHDDPHARFLRLFLSSEREVFRYVAALVPDVGNAEEIVQQTAVELWKKFPEYDPQRPFTPWACRFALNVVKQWSAGQKRWQSLLDGGLAEELVNRREQLRPRFENRLHHLNHCLEKLTAEQRGIVDAYYSRRERIEAIATATRRSVDAVYKALQRIRLLLRQCIERAERAGESFA